MDPYLHQGGGQDDNERTILDYLNEDCWQAVLSYVPVKDILRTERTSRHWQRVVLGYLSHVKISADMWWTDSNRHNTLFMKHGSDYSSFKLWTYKLGASLIFLEKYFWSKDVGVDILGRNCPNIEVLKLGMIRDKLPENSTEEYFLHLKQIFLDYCEALTDDCVSQFLAGNALEELKIFTNKQVTGQFLSNLKSTQLKSLVLRSCWGLELPPLLSFTDRLASLTKLVLARVCNDIRDHVHLLLDNLPHLEYLTVLIDGVNELRNSNLFYGSVCRLKKLRHLSSNYYTWDQHLEDVTENCKELEVLKLLCWHVTDRGAATAARLGPRLTHLDLAYSEVTDDVVVELAHSCPNLTWLRLTGCKIRLAVNLISAVRRAQRASTPLKMYLEQCYSLQDDDDDIEDFVDLRFRDDERDSDGVDDLYET